VEGSLTSRSGEFSAFALALREARQRRSLAISDIAKELLLSDKQILGLESDDLSNFYLRSYAERAAIGYANLLDVGLSLDGAPPYQDFKTTLSYKTVLLDQDIRKKNWFARRPVPTIAIVLAFIAIAFLLSPVLSDSTSNEQNNSDVLEFDDVAMRPLDSNTESSEELVVAPSDVAPAKNEIVENIRLSESATGSLDKSNRFFIVINRPTSVDARDRGGRLLISGYQAPTTGMRVSGTPPFLIEVTDPDAIKVYYLGSRIRPGRSDIKGIRMVTK
jgi:hypothetical protein